MSMTDQAIDDLKRMASDIRPANLDRDPILIVREQTHGDFKAVAQLSQELKSLFRRAAQHKDRLDARHAEALDCIAMKLARALCGSTGFKDHWTDIAGYAKLAEEACKGD